MDAAELNAIRQLLREELEPVKAQIGSLENKVDKLEVRVGRLESRMDKLESRMDRLENRMDGMEAEIGSLSSQILKANIRIENDIIPNLRLLAEGHGMLAETIAHKAAVDRLEERVHTLEFTVKKVNEELQQLKKAQ